MTEERNKFSCINLLSYFIRARGEEQSEPNLQRREEEKDTHSPNQKQPTGLEDVVFFPLSDLKELSRRIRSKSTRTKEKSGYSSSTTHHHQQLKRKLKNFVNSSLGSTLMNLINGKTHFASSMRL